MSQKVNTPGACHEGIGDTGELQARIRSIEAKNLAAGLLMSTTSIPQGRSEQRYRDTVSARLIHYCLEGGRRLWECVLGFIARQP